jgi:hypothetical protein
MCGREALPGGAIVAISTVPIVVDLAVFAGYSCLFYCDTADMALCFSTVNTSTTLISAPTPPSTTALVAKQVGAGTKFERCLGSKAKYLIVATAVGTGNLVIEPVGRP